MNKKSIGILLGLAVAILFFGCNEKKTEKRAKTVTYKVERRKIERFIEAVGVVTPYFSVEVKSKASGAVLSMPFDEGDMVEKGELLLQLDPVDENRNLRRQEAQLKNMEANLQKSQIQMERAKLQIKLKRDEIKSRLERAKSDFETARANYARVKELHKQKLNADQSRDDALNRFKSTEAALELVKNEEASLALMELDIKSTKQDVKLQEARMEQEKVNLEIARIRLDETRILAPMNGVVLKRQVEPGQIISSGISNVSGGTTLMVLADVSQMYLDTEVDESDVSNISPGQVVELRAEAFPRRIFYGRVKRVAPQGEVVQNVTIFRVRIDLDKKAIRHLKPGMNATAKIVFLFKDNALSVTTKAVSRQDGKFGLLIPSAQDKPRFIPVEFGIRDSSHVEVIGDIKEGQEIIIPAKSTKLGGRDEGARNVRRGMRMLNGGSRGRRR